MSVIVSLHLHAALPLRWGTPAATVWPPRVKASISPWPGGKPNP